MHESEVPIRLVVENRRSFRECFQNFSQIVCLIVTNIIVVTLWNVLLQVGCSSEWLLFNVYWQQKWMIEQFFRLYDHIITPRFWWNYYGVLQQTNTPSCIFVVRPHWNNNPLETCQVNLLEGWDIHFHKINYKLYA